MKPILPYPTSIKGISFPIIFICIVVVTTTLFFSSCDALSLTPATTPIQVVTSQLEYLKENDMNGVFQYASPNNKKNVGGSVLKFGDMVRSGPYKYLVSHKEATILLTYTSKFRPDNWQGLVRVIPSSITPPPAATTFNDVDDDDDDDDNDNESSLTFEKTKKDNIVHEYWWILSRCNDGCFMVDMVIPNA
jgi:hypothetical protein